jgi:S-adenosylmethionine-diacylglycerol 3-amino-3-carboxypropyl transferase
MSKFLKRLSYSFGNEDSDTEHEALQIEPKHRVIGITASGDRPMHLLLKECKKLVTVDANPVQNFLFDLKSNALKLLDAEEYLSFLGATPCLSRKLILKKLIPHLNEDSARFWQHQDHLIHNGIIYEGAMEKWARRGSFLLRTFSRKEIRTLFSHSNLDEQRSFLTNKWNHKLWESCLRLAVNPWISQLFFKDPGMYAYFEPHVKPGIYLYQRLMSILDKCLAKENPLLSLVMLGKVLPEGMPPYLSHSNFETIKKRLDRVSVKTSDVITYLESVPENSFDCFSLSDVASYLDYPSYLRLLKAMYRAGSPGARFCMRQFMTRYKIPEGLKPYFSRETELEERLEKKDRAFVYNFTVGKILKD